MRPDSESAIVEQSAVDAKLLEYDHLKHLSTLSLVALGGILSLSQWQANLGSRAMLVAIVLVAVGGATSLACIEQIVKSQRTGKRLGTWYSMARWVALTSFSLGLGAFLAVFLKLFQ